jgi:hypothetical protein
MDEFVLGEPEKGQMILDNPAFNNDGWLESYRLRLIAKGCNAELMVENPPYGTSLADFFHELSDNWKGWEGVQQWAAIEDEYRIEATTNNTGHVVIKVTTNQNNFKWHLLAELAIEAGQLELAAKQLRLFLRENQNAL